MHHERIQQRRVEATRHVADSWHELELAYHTMMAKMGQAIASISEAHLVRGACIPLEAGMNASKQIATAAVHMVDGYEDIVAGHRLLGADRDRLLIRADGDGWVTPKFDTGEEANAGMPIPHLRVA